MLIAYCLVCSYFSETESEQSIGYQWGYVFLPMSEEGTVKSFYKHAAWGKVMQGWLLGFSIYIWDANPRSIVIPAFLFPFIEPVPASNYHPLKL